MSTEGLVGTWIVRPPSPAGVAVVNTVTFTETSDGLAAVWEWWTSSSTDCAPLGKIEVPIGGVSFVAHNGRVTWEGVFADADRLEMKLRHDEATKRIFERVTPAEVERVKADAPRVFFERVQALPPVRELPSNGLALTPPMGWSSWNHFKEEVSDQVIREIADAMVASGLRDAGYVYVNIDDGWQGERDEHGVLHPNEKFPDMKALADYVHATGLKLGIYSGPGPTTCAGYLGSHGFEAQDAHTFAEWGVDLLKYDWCSAGLHYKTKQEMQALYQRMGEALQATGRPIVYSLCQYGLFDVGSWGRAVGGNLWRTGGDTIIGERWPAMCRNGFSDHGNPDHTGRGGWNDADMMLIGNGGLTHEEHRTHMTLWAILASPLLLGNDVCAMEPDVAEILLNREVIAIDQDPLGAQGRCLVTEGDTEVWTKPLADGAVAVALFNRGEDEVSVEARWLQLGISDGQNVRDLWQRQDLGPLADGYQTTLPAHGAALLRATALAKASQR